MTSRPVNSRIAIVGMACCFPDAPSPKALWENVLAQRRAFRRIPPERMRAEDFLAHDPGAPDRTYTMEAALIEGYAFDRERFRVSGQAFRSADMAHWLALDVASRDRARRPDIAYGFAMGDRLHGGLRNQLEHFADCVADDEEPLVSNADARAAVEVAVAIHQSLDTGLPVSLPLAQ